MNQAIQKCVICLEEFQGDSFFKHVPFCFVCVEDTLKPFNQHRIQNLQFEEPNHIVDNIFLGQESSAINLQYLQEKSIDRILICAEACAQHLPQDKINYLQLMIEDHPNENIIPFLPQGIEFIKNGGKGNVLVHCVAGSSRSGSMVIAYVMKEKKMNYQQAFTFAKSQRYRVKPNIGFEQQCV